MTTCRGCVHNRAYFIHKNTLIESLQLALMGSRRETRSRPAGVARAHATCLGTGRQAGLRASQQRAAWAEGQDGCGAAAVVQPAARPLHGRERKGHAQELACVPWTAGRGTELYMSQRRRAAIQGFAQPYQ
jgi:hypothetical protein